MLALLLHAVALAAIDLNTVVVVVGLVGTILGVVKTLSLMGPDRDDKLAAVMEKAMTAQQGEIASLERQLLAAEKDAAELRDELAALRRPPELGDKR